jgi:ABC-2 type transport system ATP-binding protein
LWEHLSVEQNLMVYAQLYGVAEPAAAVDSSLELLQMRERRTERPARLSKGLRQRVALARTLLHHPQIVLLDEPTAGLDPESARDVRALILKIRSEGGAVLISTHNLDEVERVADRVAVLRTRLVAVDTPSALRARIFGARVLVVVAQPAEAFIRVLADAGFDDVQANGHSLSIGVRDQASCSPVIVRHLVAAGAAVQSVVSEEAPLEDVYLRLLSDEGGQP